MGKNKIDPKKNIKKIFGKRISLKTDFLDKLILYTLTFIDVFEKQMKLFQ